jgi:hypothetical protein
MAILVILLFLWLVLVILGFTIKALLWLAIVGIVLFVLTLAGGVIHSVVRRN